MSHVSEMPPPVQEAIGKLNRAISEDTTLKGNIINTFERYLSDSLWPSNFRELEKALDRLNTGLSGVLRTCLIPNIELFDPWREQLPHELAAFLKDLQECYAYKYRVGAYRTVLSGDRYDWFTVNVQSFVKRNTMWYGVSIVRNDGEQIYFEGSEPAINQLIGIIQEAMEKVKKLGPEEV